MVLLMMIIVNFQHPLTSPSKLPGKRTLTGNLELLVLNERSIRCVGDVNKYSTLARNVTELDLAVRVASTSFSIHNMVYFLVEFTQRLAPYQYDCNERAAFASL
jgi:hypothetical protein